MNYKQMMAYKPNVAATMRLQAAKGLFDGTENTTAYMESCRLLHKQTGTLLIFTRDTGYHSCGWWKNPDYERCYHLSLSFKGIQGYQVFSIPKSKKLSDQWIDAFFGDDKRLLWVEPPYSADGKTADVWHYRLFCDESWNPIKPRGEVYSKDLTPPGFLSFSELQDKLKKNPCII